MSLFDEVVQNGSEMQLRQTYAEKLKKYQAEAEAILAQNVDQLLEYVVQHSSEKETIARYTGGIFSRKYDSYADVRCFDGFNGYYTNGTKIWMVAHGETPVGEMETIKNRRRQTAMTKQQFVRYEIEHLSMYGIRNSDYDSVDNSISLFIVIDRLLDPKFRLSEWDSGWMTSIDIFLRKSPRECVKEWIKKVIDGIK